MNRVRSDVPTTREATATETHKHELEAARGDLFLIYRRFGPHSRAWRVLRALITYLARADARAVARFGVALLLCC